MRSPKERAVWTAILAVTLVGAAAAWWTADQWVPLAGPWAKQAWLKVTRPPPPTGHSAPASSRKGEAAHRSAANPAPSPRKCIQGGRTTYTDQPCPPGSDELLLSPALSVPPQ